MQGMITQLGAVFRDQAAPILNGVQFDTRIKVISETGTVSKKDSLLHFNGVKRMIIYLVNNTSYYHETYREKSNSQINYISSVPYSEIKSRHLKDFRSLYDRLDFRLGGPDLDSIPTNERLENVKNGIADPGLETIQFQYGRYLLISSSRPEAIRPICRDCGTNISQLPGMLIII